MRRLLALVLAGTLGVAFACSTGSPAAPGTPGGSGTTLTVLAGSELKDIEPLLPDLQRATGYRLQLSYVGSLDGAQRIVTGDRSQLAWFSSARYLSLLQGGGSRIVAQQKIMLSPVVMGVKHSVASGFGWTNNPNVTWADIAARAKAGQLHFGMTNPAASNSGFVALVGVAEAFAQSGSALDAGTINSAALKDFFSGQSLTAGSSGFLATSYVRGQDSLDGMINYESVLLSLNQGSQLHEKLDLVYPKDGIATADYPLLLLDRTQRDAFDKVTAWLRRPEIQTRIMQTTNRRPALPEVKPDSRFPSQVLVELPFPGSLDVINRLIAVYLDQARPPAHAIFVLDTSGSMQGTRLDSLKRALLDLTGGDTSITGQFARFRQREEITIVLFNDHVYQKRDFAVNDTSASSPDLAAIRSYVGTFQAGGGTAIYDAVYTGYQAAETAMRTEPDRLYSIVLMTDGENNVGRDGPRFVADYRQLPPEVRAVKTFAVLFGEANPAELQQVADTTGGTVFDGRSASLSQVFKDISGYQ
jgi:Ca-activated chloride channel family protein